MKRAAPGKRIVSGGGLLLIALLVWSLRDLVPAWTAKRVTVTVDLTTTTEPDDQRVQRAFEAAKPVGSLDIRWEALPNSLRQVRDSRIWVQAPSESQAVAQASAIAKAMSRQFAADGPGQLMTDVHRRATPIPDDGSILLGRVLRAVALAASLIGLAMILMGMRRVQDAPDRESAKLMWGLGCVLLGAFVLVLLPAALTMALFIMAVPGLIAGTIVYKTMKIRKAAHWPSTRARITKSAIEVEHSLHTDDAINVPVVEYEYTLGPNTFHGSHVTGADNIGTKLQAKQTLDRYPLGATVPVYYNPANPTEAVLERETPWNPTVAYASAGSIFMAGVAAAFAFANVDTIMVKLRAHFPPGAEPHLTIFFALCGMWCLFMLWDGRRQAARAVGWPTATGHIVSSGVESYSTSPGGRSGNRVELFEPIVEYSFMIKDREYHSTQVAFGAHVQSGQAIAQARAARYPQQSDVVVHYDPTNPSNAVLETKVAFGWPILALAAIFLALAVFFSAVIR